MGRQDVHLLHIAIYIVLKAWIFCQKQTWNHESGIGREDTLRHMETQQREQIASLHFLLGMDAVSVMWSNKWDTLLFELHLIITKSYRQIVFITEEHWDSHLKVLISVNDSS